MEHKYDFLGVEQNYIDKTEVLEKGIVVFPSLYIQGAAACGKSTAVKMMLGRRPQLSYVAYSVQKELKEEGHFLKQLRDMRLSKQLQEMWFVFEDMPAQISGELETEFVKFVEELCEGQRAIFVGRERMPGAFLELLWKQKMELIFQDSLQLQRQEVETLAGTYFDGDASWIDGNTLYQVTGGWAGCVAVMIRLLAQQKKIYHKETIDAQVIQRGRSSYEVNTYIQRNIVETLSNEEQEIVRRAQLCPWVCGELCEEMWGIGGAQEWIDNLVRKGILMVEPSTKKWKVAPLFQEKTILEEYKEKSQVPFWKMLGRWYGKRGFFIEMFWCFGQIAKEYQDHSLEMCYFRGVMCAKSQDWDGLEQEIQRIEKGGRNEERSFERLTVLLNLKYLDPRCTVKDLLTFVKEQESVLRDEKKQIHLYMDQMYDMSCLDGVRDLTELFACTKKEENSYANIWQQCFDEETYELYRLAKIEYYQETERWDSLAEEDLEWIKNQAYSEKYMLSVLRMLYRQQLRVCEEEYAQCAEHIYEKTQVKGGTLKQHAEVMKELYQLLVGKGSGLFFWQYELDVNQIEKIDAQNKDVLYCLAKGYLFLRQYDKAEKILQRLASYYQKGKHVRFLAEILFEQAVAFQNKNQSGKAMKSAIESFVINGTYRYVEFYTEYGSSGRKVLENTVEWMKKNSTDSWHRKKKYNYGSVLRMPEADYMEFLVRKAKQQERRLSEPVLQVPGEQLTMMETVVLQCIGQGMSNGEICEALDLKLSTVKSHIYSLYKKLGVNSRNKAILALKNEKK